MVAPARGATMLKKQIIPIVRAFQSALPRGERQQIGGSPDEDRNISIHAPTRGATSWRRSPQSNIRYFNPRSHEGSDPIPEAMVVVLPISIHAPTRGATASSIQYLDLGSISIHAPTRGATRKQVRPLLEPRDFNPRSHEGSDRSWTDALMWIWYFNPRSHEGSDAWAS